MTTPSFAAQNARAPQAQASEPVPVNPPADDDFTISDRLGVFYRIILGDGHKLADLVKAVPDVPAVAAAMRDTGSGCWAAFTGTGTAERVTARLYLPHTMEIVDQAGRKICLCRP